MIKRILSMVASIGIVVLSVGGLAYTVNAEDYVYRASDAFDDTQGDEWYYLTREVITNTYTELQYDAENERWTDGFDGLILKSGMHASSNASANHENQVVLEFRAPASGKITISTEENTISLGPNSDDGVKFWVWRNNDFLYQNDQITKGQVVTFSPIETEINEGDAIRFILSFCGNNAGDSLSVAPVITYSEYVEPPQVTPAPEGTEKDGIYNASAMFGESQDNGWHYLLRETVTNTYTEMTWNPEENYWQADDGARIANGWIHTSADAGADHEMQVVWEFEAPSDGNVTVYMATGTIDVSRESGNGVKFACWRDDSPVVSYTTIPTGNQYVFEPVTFDVRKGMKIRFLFVAISGDNSGDTTHCTPVIVYNSLGTPSGGQEPEIREDDPDKTVYSAKDDFGSFLNPWYYCYWIAGTSQPQDMQWDTFNEQWYSEEYTAATISATGMHTSPNIYAVRKFRAPKSGTVDIAMLEDQIRLTSASFVEAADGVYVSILLSTGDSVTELKDDEWLFPGDGEVINFEPLKDIKIYEGWEIWFVLKPNVNNANDSTFFSPIITYTEITDEEAPVYSNRDEPIIQNTDYFSALRDGSGTNTEGSDDSTDSMPFSIWLSLLSGIGAAIIIGGITILILVVIKKKRSKKLSE